jgi:acetyltransferase-like isoleucine patch superfamily enzyme
MNVALKALRNAMGGPAYLRRVFEERRKKNSCNCGAGVQLYPASRIENPQLEPNAILIGSYSCILGRLLVFKRGGRIRIGESCYVGEDSRIWSADSITIGDRVLISHGVNIHDSNSHSSSAVSRHEDFKRSFSSVPAPEFDNVPSAPIVIEDDAWIGFNATILKGVRIGQGAVVGAATVVTKDVPAYTIVAGNPATIIGHARP